MATAHNQTKKRGRRTKAGEAEGASGARAASSADAIAGFDVKLRHVANDAASLGWTSRMNRRGVWHGR